MHRPAAVLLALLIVPFAFATQPEVPVSSVEYGPAAFDQMFPRIATNGDVSLAAWTTLVHQSPASSQSFATRISRNGEVLDRPPIQFASEPAIARAVEWTGSHFLIAWYGRDSMSRGGVTTIDSAGEVIGEIAFADKSPTTLVCHATRCLLTLVSYRNGAETYEMLLLDSAGNRVGEAQQVGELPGQFLRMTAGTNGSDFLVVWNRMVTPSAVDLYAVVVDAGGTTRPVQVLPSRPAGASAFAVAGDRDRFILLYGASSGLAVQQIANDGKALGAPTHIPVPNFGVLSSFKIERRGTGFAILGSDREAEELLLFLFSSEWNFQKITAVAPAASFDIESSNDRIAVAFLDEGDPYVRFFDLSGDATTDRVLLATTPRPQSGPSIATDGDHVFAVWTESVNGRGQVRMSMLRGHTLEREATVQLTDASQGSARVAFSGRDYLVVWEELDDRLSPSRIMTKRFSLSGDPIDQEATVVGSKHCGNNEPGPAVASSGRDYLVTWTDCGGIGGSPGVHAARIVDGKGEQPITISEASSAAESGGVAWNGQQYVVAWLDHPGQVQCDPGPCYTSMVRASRIDSAGVLLDPAGIAITPEDYYGNVAATAGRDGVFVSWSGNNWLEGRKVHADGSIGAARAIVPFDAFDYSVTWTGSHYVIVWADAFDRFAGDLEAAVISEADLDAGESTQPFVVVRTAAGEASPVVIARSSSHLTFAYQRLWDDPDYGAESRVFLRDYEFGRGGRRRAARR